MAVGLITSAHPVQPDNLNDISFAQLITRLMPMGGAPLTGLTSLLKDETANNIEHGFFTKRMIFPTVKINNVGGYNTSATTLTVDAYQDVVPGDILMNERTRENMLVTSTPSTTSVVVVRGFGTTAAAAINDDDDLRTVGQASEEASLRPNAVSLVAERYVNYTQIFRNSWAVSGTAAAIPQIAGAGFVQESKQDCAALHAMNIEKALFFGQKYMGTHNGKPIHTMEGIIPRVMSAAGGNVTTLGSTTNWTQLEAALDPVLQTVTDPKGSNVRTMFVGSVAMRVITNIVRLNSEYSIKYGESAWGLQIATLKTPRGVFELVEHPLFNAYGSGSAWSKMAVIVALDSFSLAYLRKTENTSYNENGAVVDNGIDAKGGTLTTELTCVIKNPAAFGIIYNFTAAAVG